MAFDPPPFTSIHLTTLAAPNIDFHNSCLQMLRIGFGTGAGSGRSTGKEQKRIGRASERTGSRRTWLQLVRCALVHTGVLFWKVNQNRKGNRGNRSRYSDWRYRRKHLSIYTNYVFHMEQVRRDREWKA